MHPAAVLQLERMIGEYNTWRAVPETERSPAPTWWWGPAMELRASSQPLPAEWCAQLERHRRRLASYEELRDHADLPNGVRLALDSGIGHQQEYIRFWSRLRD